MTTDEYWKLVMDTSLAEPEWRWGQTCFNVLYRVRPDLSEQIRGHFPRDPFNVRDGQPLTDFSLWLEDAW